MLYGYLFFVHCILFLANSQKLGRLKMPLDGRFGEKLLPSACGLELPDKAHASLAACGEMCCQLCSALGLTEKRPQLSPIFFRPATQFVTGWGNVDVPAPLQRLAAGGKGWRVAGAQRCYCRQ